MKEKIEDFKDVMRDVSVHHDLNIIFFSDLPGAHLQYRMKNKDMRAAMVSSMKNGPIICIYKFVRLRWDKIPELKVSNKYHAAVIATHEVAGIKECKHCIIS